MTDIILPGLHVLIDDVRTFYVDVTLRTAKEAREFFAQPQNVEHLYMDHDLGCLDEQGRDDNGYHVLTWILEQGHLPNNVTLVTMNPVGRDNMGVALMRHGYVQVKSVGPFTYTRSKA